MACGKCNYEPRLIAWPHIYKPTYPANKLPWAEVAGSVDGTDYDELVAESGKCLMTLRVQAVNLLPGDVVNWFYSPDGATWYAITAGPTDWGLMDGNSYIDYSDSTEDDVLKPLAEGGAWWGIEVERDGCSTFQYRARFEWEAQGAVTGTVQAEGWLVKITDPVEHDIRANGVTYSTVNAAFYAYAQQLSYELCVGEETLIPDAIELEQEDLVLDCPEAGGVVELNNLLYLDNATALVTNHLDTMTVGAVLGTLYHDQFGSRTFYTVGAEQGIDIVTMYYFDLYGRIFSKKVRIVLQCDEVIADQCGPCSILANWTASLAPYYHDDELYAEVAPPWADTGATIDGTAAATFKPASGKVSAMLVLQALNILPDDVLLWEYSPDGSDWYGLEDNGGGTDWGLSEDVPFVSTALSTDTGTRLPLTDGAEFYLRLTVEREGCDDFVVDRLLTVEMDSPTLTSQATTITLKADDSTVSVASGRYNTLTNTAPSDVTGLETYFDCEGGCDPTVTDGSGGGDGTGNEDIDELFDTVGSCMEQLAANLWVDTEQLPCG